MLSQADVTRALSAFVSTTAVGTAPAPVKAVTVPVKPAARRSKKVYMLSELGAFCVAPLAASRGCDASAVRVLAARAGGGAHCGGP